METLLTCGAMSKPAEPGQVNAIDPDHLVGVGGCCQRLLPSYPSCLLLVHLLLLLSCL
jgi:hypothetical protein